MRALRGHVCTGPRFSSSARHLHGVVHIFEGEAGRLEHRDLGGSAPYRRATSGFRAQLVELVLGEAVREQVAALEACHQSRIDHHLVGMVQDLGVKLTVLGEVRPYRVNRRTGGELSLDEDRLRRTRGGDKHITATRGSLRVGRFNEEANASARLCDKPVAADRRVVNHEHAPQMRQYSGHDLNLALGLPTGTEDNEHLARSIRQILRGDHAGGADATLAERVSLKGGLRLSVGRTVGQKGEVGVLRDVRFHYAVAIQAPGPDTRRERPYDVWPHASDYPSAGGHFTAPPRPRKPKAYSRASMAVGMGRISLTSPHAATRTSQGV
jgi:hypothetical protein